MTKNKVIPSLCLILALTLAGFLPSLWNGFVNWDDDVYIVNNILIRHLSLANLNKIFSSFFSGNYQPLTIITYLLEYRLFKLRPSGYHLTNIILHSLNSLFVFWLFFLLTKNVPVSLITALFFGIHPLRVESVAWVSERKDVLYALFFLAAVILYCYYLKARRPGAYYYSALVLSVFSLLSKAMAITLPAVLLLVDYRLDRRRDKSMIMDKLPFFMLSLIFGAIAVLGQYSTGTVKNESFFNLAHKTGVASYSIVFYLNKLFMPINLSCLYPYKNVFPYARVSVAVVILLIIVIVSLRYTRKIAFGSLFFCITILPVLQFVPIGETIVADRYTYLPALGIFYLLGEGFIWLYARRIKHARAVKTLCLIILAGTIGILVLLTWKRCEVWKDSVILWTDVLNKHPGIATAYNNRGIAFLQKGEYGKAKSDFNQVAVVNPGYYGLGQNVENSFYNLNLSNLYNSSGRHEQAIGLLENALNKSPQEGYKYYVNLAVSYAAAGRTEKAVALLEKASEDGRVNKSECLYNLGLIYKNMGDRQKAMAFFSKAIEADPGFADAYYTLGIIYHDISDLGKAIFYYKKAIELDYDNADAYNDLATAYFSIGNYRGAIALSRKAIEINPRFDKAYSNLGSSYCQIGKYKEAIASLERALELNPGLSIAHNSLAVAYYCLEQYALSIKHCDRAVELGYQMTPQFLDALKQYRK